MSTRPVRNTSLAVFVIAAMVALAAGCGLRSEPVTASMISPERPAASELAPDLDNGGLDDFELPDLELPDLPDLEIPGLGDLGDLGLDGFGECVDLLLAYSQLMALALFSSGSEEEIDEVIGELEQSIPPELSDELRIVAETLSAVSQDDLFEGAGALSDPAFLEANDAITSWLSTECVDGEGA